MRLAIILFVAAMSSGCAAMTLYVDTVPDFPIEVVIIDNRWPPPIIIERDRYPYRRQRHERQRHERQRHERQRHDR